MSMEQQRKVIFEENGPTIEMVSGPKKDVWIIPGQGTKIGKLSEEFVINPKVQQIYNDAKEIFGFDVLEMTRGGSEEDKKNTLYAQPMLAAYYAGGLAMLKDSNPEVFEKYPDYVAGQSFGFVIACYVAGYFKDHKDLFTFVKARAQGFHMAEPGGMAIVSENPRTIDKNSKATPVPDFRKSMRSFKTSMPRLVGLEEAIVNSGSIVYAGPPEAIDELERLTDQDKVRIKRLETTGPFHHPRLMKPAIPYVEQALADIEPGEIVASLILNTNGKVTKDPRIIRQELIDQITKVARWDRTDARIRREAGEVLELGSDKGPFTKAIAKASENIPITVGLSALFIGGMAFGAKALFERQQRKKQDK